jgi:FkbM family methyltransferase
MMLQQAALAPPAIKTGAFQRACALIARTSFPDAPEMLLTNLGISSGLRCKVPLEKEAYVFGRPDKALPERATLALTRELCRDCRDFVDVGANAGLFTLAVACRAPRDLRLHWFEPDPLLYERLQANLAANAIEACGNRAAVAAAGGTATFFRNLTDDSSGSLTDHFASNHATAAVPVATVSLTEYFRKRGISDALVKVDVEGAGEQVWRGAREVAANMRYLIMEIIGPETQCRLPSTLIGEGGFHAYYIEDFDLVASKDGSYDYVAPFWNWLFCRLDPPALRARLAGTKFRVREGAM